MSQFIDLSSNEDTNSEDINERSIDMSSNDLNLFVEQTEDLVSDCDHNQPIGTNKSSKVGRKSFTLKFKLQVIQWYKENGKNKSKTARHYTISR
jgi:hypothetical protein